jgi:hypothetical protein
MMMTQEQAKRLDAIIVAAKKRGELIRKVAINGLKDGAIGGGG